jgi:hypothetical protein
LELPHISVWFAQTVYLKVDSNVFILNIKNKKFKTTTWLSAHDQLNTEIFAKLNVDNVVEEVTCRNKWE